MNKTEREIRIAQQEADRRERDKQMIMNPDAWPLWPRLPLKRWYGSGTDWDDDQYLGVMFDSSSEIGGGVSLTVHVGLMSTSRTITYSDLDALVADWRVD
jgi:hypothetical protein